MYNGALADMNLGSDPYTSNRYAFTGGNPTSMVELDGHMPAPEPGGTCTTCGRENTFLYNPFDLCGLCNFGLYNSAHDTAILLVAGYLRSEQPKGGGEVTMDISQSGGLKNPRNAIAGGSSENPGKNVGYADLIYWTDTTVYIWDAKHAGGSAERGGKKDVENKVKALQKQLKANHDTRKVKAGFEFPMQSGVNWRKGAEWVTAWPSTRSSSVIAYNTRKIETRRVPEPEPAKEPASRPSWLTGALLMGAGVVVGAVAAADDVTGIGVADDPFLFPVAGGLITSGAAAF